MRKRALVVDAQMGVRTLVGTVLQRDGVEVELARHSKEGPGAGFKECDLLVTAIDLDQQEGGIAAVVAVFHGAHPAERGT